MITIRYSLIGAYFSGVNEHPQKQMEQLGIKVISYEGIPIADCIIMEVENIPDILPEYIEIIKKGS